LLILLGEADDTTSPMTADADSATDVPETEVPKRESPTLGASGSAAGGYKSSEEGLDVLNGGMRDMVDLVNRLRASGIEDLGLPLPRIAVVGNQSAGKSSLIEAISGVGSSLHYSVTEY
jgi:hypothetical protein